MEKLHRVSEVAELLGLAPETVYRKVKSGEIPAIRVGGSLRFPASLLDRWIESKARERPDKWRSYLNRFVFLLRKTWGRELKSVVLFGSQAAGKARPESDIDLLVICDALPRRRLERQNFLFQLAKRITPAFAHKLSPVPMTSKEALEMKPLYLGILTSHEILWDQDDFFRTRLNEIKGGLESAGAEEVKDEGGGSYWVFPESPSDERV